MRAAAIALLLAAPGGLAAATWEDGEATLCELVAEYDARPGVPSLFDQFEHAAFEAYVCADTQGCEVRTPLRFERSVEIVPLLRTAAEGEELDRVIGTIAASVDYGSAFLSRATGLDVVVSVEPERTADHRMVLVIRDEAAFDAAAAAGTSEDFLVSEMFVKAWGMGVACFTEPYFDEAGLKADTVSYIMADLPLETLAACVKSEIVSAAGLGSLIGRQGIWEDDWGRGTSQGLAGESYSVRDWALLRLLHHPDVPPGTPRDEVMARLRAWHDARCPSGG